ncbi:hypothetical protein VDG37_20915 [Xanthomonas campestris pv. raphani]|uniref:hypothetical protein n=1 Tax=Xanthomonas campestris TaxID=339 RepID=UPI002B2249B5|nr:hypothetical protein [Xanthomonas campestris]MEA9834086.1 hypothetical protein [Xanthomonas campestris pv. raphani]MEA9949128.1 hypothetical protein [Xanthomonas campestris pv. raphani]MEA9955121.1 hypothetical protein [Xanthomonas campestris pv. raphani]
MVDLDEIRTSLEEWRAEAATHVAKEKITGGVSEVDYLIKEYIRENHKEELNLIEARLNDLLSDIELNPSEYEVPSDERYLADLTDQVQNLHGEIFVIIR